MLPLLSTRQFVDFYYHETTMTVIIKSNKNRQVGQQVYETINEPAF